MNNDSPPPRQARPIVSGEAALGVFFVGLLLLGVFGGAALSGLIAGNGLQVLNYREMIAALSGLWKTPGNPGAAWPPDAQTGPGWLTWTCIALTATAYCLVVGIACAEIDIRRRRRSLRSHGLIDRHQLRRAGLDARSAVRKAADEFPSLVGNAAKRGWRK